MQGMLYGVGTGPGDPQLITLKALKVIKDADIIITLRNDKEQVNSALSVILHHIKEVESRHKEIVFPSKGRCHTFMEFWLDAARLVQKYMEKGEKVVFAVPEDPVVFSAFSYLVDILEGEMEELTVEIVPGISLYSAGTAFLKIPLVMENEKLAILQAPVSTDELSEFCQSFDAIAIFQRNVKQKDIIDSLEKLDRLDNTYFLTFSKQQGRFVEFQLDELGETEIEDELLFLVKSY